MLNNTTAPSLRFPTCVKELDKTFIMAKLFEAIAMSITNIVVLVLYFTLKKDRKKISNFLLLNQAITDLYVAVCLWYELAIDITKVRLPSLLLLKVAMFEYSIMLSLGSLLLGALERYLSITKTFFHRSKITLERVFQAAICLWLFSLAPVFLLLLVMTFNHRNVHLTRVMVYSYVVDAVMFIFITTIVYLLLMTLKAARTSCNGHVETICLQLNDGLQNRQRSKEIRARKRSIRLLVIFIIMISAYILTFVPFVAARVFYDIGLLDTLSLCRKIIIGGTSNLLYKFSSLFNPFLTIILKEDYRRALMKKNGDYTGKYTRPNKVTLKVNGEHYDRELTVLHRISSFSSVSNISSI